VCPIFSNVVASSEITSALSGDIACASRNRVNAVLVSPFSQRARLVDQIAEPGFHCCFCRGSGGWHRGWLRQTRELLRRLLLHGRGSRSRRLGRNERIDERQLFLHITFRC